MFARRSTSAPRARAVSVALAAAVLLGACTSPAASTRPPAPVSDDLGAPGPDPTPAPGEPAPREPAPREPAPAAPEPAEIHVQTSDDRTSYLVELVLRRDDLVLEGELLAREMAYTLVDGGQFEIYVRPAVLPARGPGCEAVIVRMPWTDPKLRGAAPALEAKRQLFARLDDVVHARSADARVVLQLDPYVEVAAGPPLAVSLTQCTVFFRHAHDSYAYVDHLGPAGF